jgi:hypothetical protein
MSTTVAFTYRLLPRATEATGTRPEWPFLKLKGIAKEVFKNLGGGEAFIQKERERFHGLAHQPRADR